MLHRPCYRSVDVGIPKFLANAAEAVEDAKTTVSLGAAVSVAALIIAVVALVVAVVKD
jgi:MFS-type transporter involved in bile tolerance (Atg22 family)